MRPLTHEEFKTFLNSYVDEATYFNYSKKDLITLREYLGKIQKIKAEYDDSISEPLKRIQDKNKWVTEIIPADDLMICGKKEPNIEVKFDAENGRYVYNCESAKGIGEIIKLSFRREVINNSEEELIEIGKKTEKLLSDFEEVTSITGNFTVINSYNYSILRFQNHPLFLIERTSNRIIDSSITPIPTIQRNKLLQKIMIKRAK